LSDGSNCIVPAEIAEWVAKAEADLATARRELRVGEQANFDAVWSILGAF
jgi:hypothetical protein